MALRAVDIPTKCTLCGVGTLKNERDVGLIRLDTKAKILHMKTTGTADVFPAHVLACDNCGHLVLLSAQRIPEVPEL